MLAVTDHQCKTLKIRNEGDGVIPGALNIHFNLQISIKTKMQQLRRKDERIVYYMACICLYFSGIEHCY